MASGGGSLAGGPSVTVERIVSEGVLTAAKIILEARFPTRARGSEQQQPRPWFNIEVEEVDGAAKALERWRREGPSLPLVLEVFLQPWGAQAAGQDRVETLLERWAVHYYPMLPEGPSGGPSHLSRSHLSRLNPSSVYKRLVITLRSLYTYLRVLPAYRMYRACKRQRGSSFTLGYRLHSTLPGSSAAAAPGSRRMQHYQFGPVDTPYGQLRISVDYQPASTVTILEQTTSPPPLPQIIADYVGGGGREGGGGGVGARPLRHAMSASAVSPPLQAALPPAAASPSPPQHQHAQAGMGSSPQGGGGSLARTAGGWPIRRSWSSSMRGASPQRPLSQPPSELPSPTTTQDTPYGSAPQAVSLPAMLRTLSASAGRYLVGSPSGRPPLAKPPRAASSAVPPAALPAGRPPARSALDSSPASGGGAAHPLAAARAAAAAEDEADSEAEGSGSPCGSAGSGARQSSAPMSIPGRGGGGLGAGAAGRGRRLRSSSDLWGMHHAAAMHKPLSAPAVSHMQQPAAAAARGGAPGCAGGAAAAAPGAGAQGVRSRGQGVDSSEPSPSPPPTRLPLIPGTLESESSGSAASSLYPTSCSPQLPFAFTPSAQSQSLANFAPRPGTGLDRASPRLGRTPSGPSVPQQAAMQQLRALAAAGSGGGTGTPAGAVAAAAAGPVGVAASGAPGSSAAGSSPSSGSSGGVTGRELPASTALMRRTSWSSRSSAFSPLAGESSQPGVGYSVSPMQDPALESILGGSTPRHFCLASASGGLPPSPLTAAAPLPTGAPLGRLAGGGGAGPPLLTFPAPSPEMSGGLDETDVLPFALDEGSASPIKPRSPAGTSPSRPVSTPASSTPPTADARAPPLPQAPASTAQAPAAAWSHAAAAAGAAFAAAAPPAAAPPPPAAAPPPPPAQPPVDSDAAVGAFVRLIQEAPPLRLHAGRAPGRAASADLAGLPPPASGLVLPGTSSGSDSSAATCLSDGRGGAGGLTLQAGMRQFSRLRERLQQRGVMLGPCPAEA